MSFPVIYTDLDGTLLDTDSYSAQDALPLLQYLKDQDLPVIPCTSKTFGEVMALHAELPLAGPAIVENGSAVCVPNRWPIQKPEEARIRGDYWIQPLGLSRREIQNRLAAFSPHYGEHYSPLSEIAIPKLCALTGLSIEQAALAKQREFGETLVWHGNSKERSALAQALKAVGLRLVSGGRFSHVLGGTDKAVAMLWLHQKFLNEWKPDAVSIAAGDAPNDIEMLNAADYALIVRSPRHPPPDLQRRSPGLISHQEGPAGWAWGIEQLIQQIEESSRYGRLLPKWNDHNTTQFR